MLTELMTVHGSIMAVTAVLLLPFGALAMRLLGFGGFVWFHAGWQLMSLFLLTAGFGIGVHMAKELGLLYTSTGKTHTTLGTCIFALFWLQPFLGYAHHIWFVRKHSRTWVSHVHIWYGRALFVMAMVNGGLGLQLAANTTKGKIAYSVVAGIVGVVYIAVTGFGECRRKMRGKGEDSPRRPHGELTVADEPPINALAS